MFINLLIYLHISFECHVGGRRGRSSNWTLPLGDDYSSIHRKSLKRNVSNKINNN